MLLRRAADVLPSAVLRDVQKSCSSCALWIPQAVPLAEQRRVKALALRQQGMSLRAIAETVSLSVSRVNVIVRVERTRSLALQRQVGVSTARRDADGSDVSPLVEKTIPIYRDGGVN